MTMTDTRITTGSSADRLVTVADLQHEFDKERRLIDSRFAEAASRAEMLDYRIIGVDRKLDDFKAEALRRFELTDKRFEQVDKRFELVNKRFDQVDKRFDALDVRLRSSKTLAVMSLTAAASIASVVISLLK
ncbi:MAG: hypothetical protein ACKO97_13855 [Actinomycetota bacterium]